MNPGIHHINSVSLQPLGQHEASLFDLNYQYRDGGLLHRAFAVHVPTHFHDALQQGLVTAFHLEVVQTAFARAAWPSAKFVMLGVELVDGRCVTFTPRRLLFTSLLFGAASLAVAGWLAGWRRAGDPVVHLGGRSCGPNACNALIFVHPWRTVASVSLEAVIRGNQGAG